MCINEYQEKIKLVYHDFMKIVIWDKAKLKSEFIFKKILNNHSGYTSVAEVQDIVVYSAPATVYLLHILIQHSGECRNDFKSGECREDEVFQFEQMFKEEN